MDDIHFYNIFLSEMPRRINGSNSLDAQLSMIQEMIVYGDQVETVSNNIYKIVNGDQSTYWCGNEDASMVSIIIDTEQDGAFNKIVLTSKNPTINKGSPPYASDLYLIIKSDIGSANLALSSDSMISDDAIRLWKGLVSRGNAVSVFDKNQHQYVLQNVTSADKLNNFIGDASSSRYVFVLSESVKHQRGIQHAITIIELKRMSGYPLFENIPK